MCGGVCDVDDHATVAVGSGIKSLALYLRAITLHNRQLLSLICIAITVGALVYVLIVVKGGLR
jgi:hypothetical protein